MKWLVNLIVGLIVGFVVGWVWAERPKLWPEKLPQAEEQVETPLTKYTIENLGKRDYKSEIFLDDAIATTAAYTVYKFHFDSDGKNVTGLTHVPNSCMKCPAIVQFRGYAEPEKYYQGYGTKHSAEMFAANGFISLAPDFLGYGESASPSADIFEARFETYTTALNLLAAVKNWERGNGNIGIWGHSNGGQIALTVMEISQKDYPMILWAPVSAGFPYSILYYMNDNTDGDRQLRGKLVDFEKEYDSAEFNLLNYLQRINSPIQIHQGSGDKSVPADWNRNLVTDLEVKGKEVKHYEYPGADHNLVPDWGLVVERDVLFLRQKLGLTE